MTVLLTYSPPNLLEVRKIYQRYTGLPADALGIQHWQPDGGGYHEGNDLLARAGRLNTDYSKRESSFDRPGSNAASAIDIGYFDVTLPNGRRVTLRDRSAWVLAHWDECIWIRELIYSPDGKRVHRKDRLGTQPDSGDPSHLTHDHESYHRDFVDDPRIPAFHQRFWDEMGGVVNHDKIGEGVFNVIVVPKGQANGVDDAFYGVIAGRPPVDIPDGPTLVAWRQLKDVSGGREFAVPKNLFGFFSQVVAK